MKSIREQNLYFTYGLTEEDYFRMLKVQKGVCKICSNPPSAKEHKANKHGLFYLNVDHDHATGKIRGLLCQNCNMGLGKFKDNPALLKKAIEYIGS